MVSLVSFLVVRLIPGDPAVVLLGASATEQQIGALRAQLGLDQPLPLQYLYYLAGLLTGDLGKSLQSGRPIVGELGQRLPATLELALASVAVALPAGILLGTLSAVRRNRPADHVVRVAALLGVSVPIFWLALAAQIVFGVWLDLLPVSGRTDVVEFGGGSGFVVLGALAAGDLPRLADALRHLALPALVLGAFFAATVSRMMRATLLEVLTEDYVRTARAKGLRTARVIARHAVRNALLPVVTISGLKVAELLSGAVLTETIFAWPGLGRYMYEGITGRDYPVVQSTTLLFAAIYLIVLLVVDLAYGVLDPRLRVSGGRR